MFDPDFDEEQYEEWFDLLPPVLTYANTAVDCLECHALTSPKYHQSKSGFSYLCNKCRRKASLRKAQARHQDRKATERARAVRKITSALIVRLDKARIANYEKMVKFIQEERSGVNKTERQHRMQDMRVKKNSFYDDVRRMMERDIAAGKPRTYRFYIDNDELWNKHFGGKEDGIDARGKDEGPYQEAAEELWQ